MKKVFRKHFDYDVEAASDESAITCVGPSLTVQSQAEDADLNVIMRRFGVTGQFPENPVVPTYGDFSEVVDYRSALDAINQAQHAFMEFPADLRSRFGNDPQKLLEFCENGANIEEARKLGLLKPPAPPAPAKEVLDVRVVGSDAGAPKGAPAAGA